MGRTKYRAKNIKSLASSEGQAYTEAFIQKTKSGVEEKGRSRKETRTIASKSIEIFAPHLEHFLGICYKSFQPFKYLWVG